MSALARRAVDRLVTLGGATAFHTVLRQSGVPAYSAHSTDAIFITTTLENGAQLEDVQKAAGHRDPSTTKLYDRRRL